MAEPTVAWVTGVISVPQSYLTPLGGSLYELDMEAFHKSLRTLTADGGSGAVASDTHTYEAQSLLGGITYAQKVKILDPYTVVFEDGMYAVNTVGANHNLTDVQVRNSVGVNTANSAGLIDAGGFGAAEAASLALLRHQGAIWIDTVNGTAGTVIGTNGVPENPVTTLVDALTLATATGLRHIVMVSGNVTLTSNLNEFLVELRDESEMHFAGFSTNGSEFSGGILQGVTSGTVTIRNAEVEDVGPINGTLTHCGVNGTLKLAAGRTTIAYGYSKVPGSNTPNYDFTDVAAELSMRHNSGGVRLLNMSHASAKATCEFMAGQIIIDASCNSGELFVRGQAAPITNNSAGTVVDLTGVTADSIWAYIIANAGAPVSGLAAGSAARFLAENNIGQVGRVELDYTTDPVEEHYYDFDGNLLLTRYLKTNAGEKASTQIGVQTKRLLVP